MERRKQGFGSREKFVPIQSCILEGYLCEQRVMYNGCIYLGVRLPMNVFSEVSRGLWKKSFTEELAMMKRGLHSGLHGKDQSKRHMQTMICTFIPPTCPVRALWYLTIFNLLCPQNSISFHKLLFFISENLSTWF
jgi:hypothetical protein